MDANTSDSLLHQENKRLVLLDVMRALAALWVMLFHYYGVCEAGAAPIATILSAGFLGVPIFFVISGFCISKSFYRLQQRDGGWLQFICRRAWRVYPPMWLSLIVTIAIPQCIELISSLRTRDFQFADYSSVPYAKYDLQKFLQIGSLVQVFETGGDHLPKKFSGINAALWSLAIEMQFYAIISLAMLLRSNCRQFLLLITLCSVATSLSITSFDIGIFLPYWPNFALGMGLWQVNQLGIKASNFFGRAHGITTTGLILVIAMTIIGTSPQQYDYSNYLPWSALFAVLIWMLLDIDLADKPRYLQPYISLASNIFSFIGRASYSIYLTHLPFIFLATYSCKRFSLPTRINHFIVITLTLACCFLFYFICEKPFEVRKVKQLDK